MDKTSFRKKARARLRRISDKAATHCGHDSLVADLVNTEDRFLDWIVKHMEVEYSNGLIEGRRLERLEYLILSSAG